MDVKRVTITVTVSLPANYPSNELEIGIKDFVCELIDEASGVIENGEQAVEYLNTVEYTITAE